MTPICWLPGTNQPPTTRLWTYLNLPDFSHGISATRFTQTSTLCPSRALIPLLIIVSTSGPQSIPRDDPDDDPLQVFLDNLWKEAMPGMSPNR